MKTINPNRSAWLGAAAAMLIAGSAGIASADGTAATAGTTPSTPQPNQQQQTTTSTTATGAATTAQPAPEGTSMGMSWDQAHKRQQILRRGERGTNPNKGKP